MAHLKILILLLTMFLLGSCNKGSLYTADEQEFIDNNIIVWAAEDNYPPFVYLSGNEPIGFSVDYLNEISKRSGLKIRLENHCQLVTCLALLKDKKVDLVTSVRVTPERSEYADFTRPYITVDTVLIKKVNQPATVGAGKGYAIVQFLKQSSPDIKVVEFDNDELALSALIAGSIDSIALDVASARVLREKYKFKFDESSLQINYPLSFAIIKNSKLKSIIDKTITDIGPREIWK